MFSFLFYFETFKLFVILKSILPGSDAIMESNNDHDDDAAAALAAHFVDADAAINHDDVGETETVHDADDDERQAANDTRLIQKALTILQDQINFPVRTRNKIVELAQ